MDDLDFLNTDHLPGVSADAPVAGGTQLVIHKPDTKVTNENLTDVVIDDLNSAREALFAQQQMMMQVAEEFSKMAMTAEHPRMIEALGGFFGSMTKNSEALVGLHKKARESLGITAAPTATPQTSNQQINAQAVFIGTGTEMLDMYGTRQDTQDLEIAQANEINEVRSVQSD